MQSSKTIEPIKKSSAIGELLKQQQEIGDWSALTENLTSTTQPPGVEATKPNVVHGSAGRDLSLSSDLKVSSPHPVTWSGLQPPYYVYVDNIPSTASLADIYYFFDGIKNVQDVYVYPNFEPGRYSRECFIQLKDLASIDRVLTLAHDKFFDNPVSVSVVDSRNCKPFDQNVSTKEESIPSQGMRNSFDRSSSGSGLKQQKALPTQDVRGDRALSKPANFSSNYVTRQSEPPGRKHSQSGQSDFVSGSVYRNRITPSIRPIEVVNSYLSRPNQRMVNEPKKKEIARRSVEPKKKEEPKKNDSSPSALKLKNKKKPNPFGNATPSDKTQEAYAKTAEKFEKNNAKKMSEELAKSKICSKMSASEKSEASSEKSTKEEQSASVEKSETDSKESMKEEQSANAGKSEVDSNESVKEKQLSNTEKSEASSKESVKEEQPVSAQNHGGKQQNTESNKFQKKGGKPKKKNKNKKGNKN